MSSCEHIDITTKQHMVGCTSMHLPVPLYRQFSVRWSLASELPQCRMCQPFLTVAISPQQLVLLLLALCQHARHSSSGQLQLHRPATTQKLVRWPPRTNALLNASMYPLSHLQFCCRNFVTQPQPQLWIHALFEHFPPFLRCVSPKRHW